jgi:outer membrane biosynthesis protein TonB
MKSTNRPSHSAFLGLLCTVALAASAFGAQQDASAFFHKGAQHFLATNEAAQAKLAVTNGLTLYPSDEKLKKLWELLNQQQQQQNKDDQSKQEEKKEQESKDQQKKGDDKKEQEKKSEEQKKEQDKKPDEEKQSQQPKPEQGKPEDQPEADGQPQAMRMTPQQAMQLLEALKAEEKAMPFKPVMKTNRQDRIFKDW